MRFNDLLHLIAFLRKAHGRPPASGFVIATKMPDSRALSKLSDQFQSIHTPVSQTPGNLARDLQVPPGSLPSPPGLAPRRSGPGSSAPQGGRKLPPLSGHGFHTSRLPTAPCTRSCGNRRGQAMSMTPTHNWTGNQGWKNPGPPPRRGNFQDR